MTEENVEIVCRSIQAYNDRDVDGMLECFAPDAVVDWSNSRGVNAHVFRGTASCEPWWRTSSRLSTFFGLSMSARWR